MKRNVLVVTCLFVLTLSACTMRERAPQSPKRPARAADRAVNFVPAPASAAG